MTDDNATLLRTRLDAAIELLRSARALAESNPDDDDLFCVRVSCEGALTILNYARHLMEETQ